jgi:hypothetical protein
MRFDFGETIAYRSSYSTPSNISAVCGAAHSSVAAGGGLF